ncbi:NYN domain-containing protein [Nocardioides sp. SYSU D00038]|uniref:NYN domain-containing protein n=1 Tax=Nocardioides sp. SYSU D00038 TaxID=2812554 RepID=UPI0019673078|nr:NYN domain-containing protein [Nocardioides sp. SYSU D00038]
MPDSNARLAVLIDADNTSVRHLPLLLEEVAKYGSPTVKRAYGDWTNPHLSGWKDELNRNAVRAMQQFAYTTGKNSSDSALIIDAMDLLYTGDLDAFAIVSSDSDFTGLVTRLRESGKTVYGFGRRRTPEALVAACDRFVFLEVLGTDPEPDEADETDEADGAARLPDLRTILSAAIDTTSGDDGWAHLGAVGTYLGTRHASFDPRNYGYSKLIALARGQDYLEVEQDGGGPVLVRLSPRHAPAKKAASSRRGSGRSAAKKTAAKTPD